MTALELAERIARKAHATQKEPVTGAPYITHVERVVAMVEGDKAKAVAWLHDVLEDTELRGAELVHLGIPEPVVYAVGLLTRAGSFSYGDYIDRLRDSQDVLALVVKIADLKDHLRHGCPESLRPRYERALATLTA